MSERTETPTAARDWATLSDEARASMAKFFPTEWRKCGDTRDLGGRPGHTMKRIIAITAISLGLAACSASTAGPSLSESFCSDLKGGSSLFQLYSVVKADKTPEQFASSAYGMAAISCPAELRSNAGLRDYLLAWNINPDT